MTVELTRSDAGGEIVLATGDTVVLKLAEQGGTGYRWQLVECPDCIELVEDATEGTGTQAAPGATYLRRLTFRAPRPGRGRLALADRRSWEGEADAADRFDATITVG